MLEGLTILQCKVLEAQIVRNIHVLLNFVRYIEDICFFSVKDRNLFHRVDTIGDTFRSGAATRENITDDVHEMK